MSKLSKKERKRLKKQRRQNKQHANPKQDRTKQVPSIKKITSYNWHFILLLAILCILVYFNSLDNQLTLVDDMQGIVFDPDIQDLVATAKKLNLQKTTYALSYNFFGYDPLPIRINSVVLHVLTTILVFYFVYMVWGRKISYIASLVFAVHPVNTEAVTWISGSPYLYYGLFAFLIFDLYMLYYHNRKRKFLFVALGIYIIEMLVMRSPWVLVPPLGLVILDQLILEKRFDVSRLWWVILFAIPISIYLMTYFGSALENRILARTAGGTRITMHTQALKPVIEGYPYSTYLMSKLYVFPKTLSVYYDGMEVTTGLYVSMYTAFVLYAALTLYLLRKNRQLAGMLIMLPFLIAPAYSPLKITWFLSERYLYSGTAFIGVLLAIGILYLKKKTNNRYLAYGILGLILVLLTVRTVLRNDDWQNTETLSYANMEAAPLSVRPYNDLGGHHYYQGDIKKAIEWYEKGLTVVPTSGTAINNLGFIYFELGPLIFWDDLDWPPTDVERARELYDNGVKIMQEEGEPRTVSYFFNKSLLYNPADINVVLHTAEMYNSLGMEEHAMKLFQHALAIDPENEYALNAVEALSH